MKLILSRKGFDSAAGGGSSPVLPDGTMVSLPIPARQDSHHWRGVAAPNGQTLGALMAELGLNTNAAACHLDPDLDVAAVNRAEGWQPSLGQIGASATHLANQGVGEGDLFLFFGRFQHTVVNAGRLKFSGRPFHALFGYLQIGTIIKPKTDEVPAWLVDHPHVAVPGRVEKDSNTIYVASRQLELGGLQRQDVSGAGMFDFGPKLQLTVPDSRRLTDWQLPEKVFRDKQISHHPAPWTREGGFKAFARGQEAVVDVWDEALALWVQEIILHGLSRSRRQVNPRARPASSVARTAGVGCD